MKYLRIWTDFVDDMELLSYAERGRLITAMLEYAKGGKQPDLTGNERFLWSTAKKNIDAQKESYQSKCESMENARSHNYRNQSEISSEITEINMDSAEKHNHNYNNNQNQNNKSEGNEKWCPTPPEDFSPSLRVAIADWIQYKKDRKDKYTETGWNKLMSQIRREAADYGSDAVIETINYSIMQGYVGILHDRLVEKRNADRKQFTSNPFLQYLMEGGGEE